MAEYLALQEEAEQDQIEHWQTEQQKSDNWIFCYDDFDEWH